MTEENTQSELEQIAEEIDEQYQKETYIHIDHSKEEEVSVKTNADNVIDWLDNTDYTLNRIRWITTNGSPRNAGDLEDINWDNLERTAKISVTVPLEALDELLEPET